MKKKGGGDNGIVVMFREHGCKKLCLVLQPYQLLLFVIVTFDCLIYMHTDHEIQRK